MEEKYFEKLEFNKIKEILKDFCITFLGKKIASELSPLPSKNEIEKAGNQTFEASNLIYRKGNIPIYEIENITIYLKILKSKNSLSSKGLLDLANILRISKNLKNFLIIKLI